jgi:hypothetical protein
VVEESGIAQSIPHPTPVRTLNHVDEDPYQTVFVLNERDSAGRVPGMKAVDDSFAWMAQLQFAPIERTEIDAWEMAPATPLEVRSLNTRWVSPEDVPQAMTAFQFQR